MASTHDPRALLPLKPAHFLLLLSLSDGDRHAYGLKKDLATRRDVPLHLGPGTLYRLIQQLLDAGLIDASDRRPVAELDDERRRYYRLTPYGRAVAAAEARRLAALVADSRTRRLIKRQQPL